MHSVKLLNSLFLLLIHWLVLYSANCEIYSRLVFIRKSKCISFRSYFDWCAIVLVPIKVECTLLQAFRDDGKF